MIGLDRLMEKPGVVAAGQFDERGNIIRKIGDIPDEAREKIAHFLANNSKAMETLAIDLADLTGSEWTPMNGWVLWGGKYALCVMHSTCLVVEAARADFNQLMVDLFLPEATGGKPPLSGL